MNEVGIYVYVLGILRQSAEPERRAENIVVFYRPDRFVDVAKMRIFECDAQRGIIYYTD